ncbi:rhomboid family intramembrane serine protease [Sphingomonas piscis]|uniref:Rhomboid family intramembrane serine protease n=2 Tax=Sphingomonas piscis TaxID=2714943 RepID=A0A6G7YSY9_9SPHN|nr:rhomboid family intramembrane serine protease [Sphingomonas piscis]
MWLLVTAAGLDQVAAGIMGFIPARLLGAVQIPGAVPAFLTPLTATLVHGGIFHLAFNLLMLLWCGTAVERVLGKGGLITLYLVGAFISAGAQFLADPGGVVPMIGASGAISAVIGAFSLSFGRPKQITKSVRLNMWLNALWLLAAWVLLQLAMGVIAGGQGYMLATPAHIGGFLAGLLLQRPLLLWRYRKA